MTIEEISEITASVLNEMYLTTPADTVDEELATEFLIALTNRIGAAIIRGRNDTVPGHRLGMQFLRGREQDSGEAL